MSNLARREATRLGDYLQRVAGRLQFSFQLHEGVLLFDGAVRYGIEDFYRTVKRSSWSTVPSALRSSTRQSPARSLLMVLRLYVR